MRITYRQEGGFAALPGLRKPRVVDLDAVDDATRDELHALVAQARFFELPRQLGAVPPGAADVRSEHLAIEDGERRHEVTVLPPTADGPVHALLAAVRRLAR